MNHGYDPILRVSLRADEAPKGSFLEFPLFLRQRHADSFLARYEATRKGNVLRHRRNAGWAMEKR